jgi:DNA-binding transcriptional LysR family regulator
VDRRLEASRQLHLTQSTVSARIQRLEEELGARLFVRNRGGAALTTAGRRFLEYAKRLVLTADQARHDVGLPQRYRATLHIGGRIALWEGFLPRWVGWMRRKADDVLVRSEIGFEEDLMRRLIEGTLDVGLMYTPTHSPGLMVEHLFDETLILVSTRKDDTGPGEDYIYIRVGPGLPRATHTKLSTAGTPAAGRQHWLAGYPVNTGQRWQLLPTRAHGGAVDRFRAPVPNRGCT